MKNYAVQFKGWNGKRDHLVIVKATNPQDAMQRAADDNPGWLTVNDCWAV